MSPQTRRLYEFGAFRLDAQEKVLLRDGEIVQITPKAFDMLVALVENHGRLVEKQELMQRLWPDSFVEEGNLAQNVSLLRRALGENLEGEKFIETVPRRGYRFIATVKGAQREADSIDLELPSTDIAITDEQESQASANDVGSRAGSAESWNAGKRRLNQKHRVLMAIPMLAIVVVAVLYFLVWRKPEPTAQRAIKSIAVLPFKSLGAGNDDEYLGVGIADTLTTRLSSLQLLAVRPSSAVLKYADSQKETAVTGRELNVDSLLEGSIQRMGERVRVTVRLVNVSDVSLLWADHFDENFTDIFRVEDSISTRVAAALALKLSGDEQRRLIKRDTDNAEAYRHYLKGRFFWNKRTAEGFKLGIAQFRQAVDEDPNYALAYAGLADSYTGLTFYNFDAPNETMPKAKEAATNALRIDRTLAEAHAALAHVKVNYDWDWSDAEKEFNRSIELAPDYATAHQWYAIHYLTAAGRMDDALREMKRALDLEPASLVMNTFWGATLYFARRYDDAIEQCRKTIEMDSNFAVAHWHLGLAYEQKGMFDEAIAELQQAIALSGKSPLMMAALGHAYAKSGKIYEANRMLGELKELAAVRYVSAYELSTIYVALGDREQAFQELEKSYDERSFHLINLNVRPELAPLRFDPRFQSLARRIGLPE